MSDRKRERRRLLAARKRANILTTAYNHHYEGSLADSSINNSDHNKYCSNSDDMQTDLNNENQCRRVPNATHFEFSTNLDVSNCFEKMQVNFSLLNLKKRECSICLKTTFATDASMIYLSSGVAESMSKFLVSHSRNLYRIDAMPKIYSSEFDDELLVHSIHNDERGEYIYMCAECHRDVVRNEALPKYSIPNYVFPEVVPVELQDLSVAETLMISKSFPRCIIYVLAHDSRMAHRYLKGIQHYYQLMYRTLHVIRTQSWGCYKRVTKNKGFN